MTWRTHVMLGIGTMSALTRMSGSLDGANFGLLAIAASIGALLPDLDAIRSKLTSWQIGGIYPLAPLSTIVYKAWGHRGPLHSLIGLSVMALLAGALSLVWGGAPSVALWLGYASHLAGDACTRAGIPFWPWLPRRVHLLPASLRIVTGSAAEDALFAIVSMCVMAFLLIHLQALML